MKHACLAAAAALALAAAPAAALDTVRTASITAYTGFSIYAADELGLFEKHGLKTDTRWFPSGAPIMQAAAAGGWDMTFLGAPPMTLGGPAIGLVTVGMVAEEAGMHELIGRPDFVAAAKADAGRLRGAQVFVTTLSTGHYMTEACFQRMGVPIDAAQVIPSEQQATLSAFAAGQGDLAQVWSPQSTALRARGNVVLCDATETGLSMPAVWVAHPAFAGDPANRDKIVRWLRAQLEAVDWILADRARTFDLYKRYDQHRGFNFADDLLEGEVDLVMSTYLDARRQLALLTAADGGKPSIVRSFEDIAQFFIRQGRLQAVPDYSPFVDASYLAGIMAGK